MPVSRVSPLYIDDYGPDVHVAVLGVNSRRVLIGVRVANMFLSALERLEDGNTSTIQPVMLTPLPYQQIIFPISLVMSSHAISTHLVL